MAAAGNPPGDGSLESASYLGTAKGYAAELEPHVLLALPCQHPTAWALMPALAALVDMPTAGGDVAVGSTVIRVPDLEAGV